MATLASQIAELLSILDQIDPAAAAAIRRQPVQGLGNPVNPDSTAGSAPSVTASAPMPAAPLVRPVPSAVTAVSPAAPVSQTDAHRVTFTKPSGRVASSTPHSAGVGLSPDTPIALDNLLHDWTSGFAARGVIDAEILGLPVSRRKNRGSRMR